MTRLFYAFLLILATGAGCADEGTDAPIDYSRAKQMTVTFTWPADYGTCFDLRNPELKLSNIPEDTTYFRVNVVDVLNNNVRHGGGTVFNRGKGKIAFGTLAEYFGPCPSKSPQGYGLYEFTVLVYNSNDVLVGTGSHQEKFP